MTDIRYQLALDLETLVALDASDELINELIAASGVACIVLPDGISIDGGNYFVHR